MARLVARGETPLRSVFLVIGKIPEALGILEYWIRRRMLRRMQRIDYK
jgi:hypothetical protein